MILLVIVGIVILVIVLSNRNGERIKRSWEPVAPDQEHTVCQRCGGPCPVAPRTDGKGMRTWCGKC